MNRLLRWCFVLLAAALIGLVWTFLPLRMAKPEPYPGALPHADPPVEMRLHVLHTGSIESRASFTYRGGGWDDIRSLAVSVLLVEHPRGTLLIDAGLGRRSERHAERLPAVARTLAPLTAGTPASLQLPHGVGPDTLAGVLLTHAHWDHVSGLEDLRGVPVWAAVDERAFVERGDAPVELARSLDIRRWHEIRFDDGAYLGFSRSHDVWGDGSVVVVPAAGHTPGSVIVFLTLPDGLRVGVLGDLVWQLEGIERPAERPWLTRVMLAEDSAAVRGHISRIAALRAAFPEMLMIPAHDRRAWDALEERLAAGTRRVDDAR